MIADIGEANKSAAERANLQRDVTDRSSSHPLDQWRGLALVLVLAGHAFHETGRVEGLGRDAVLVEEPGEQAVIRRAKELIAGSSLRGVVRVLADEGFVSRSGAPFQATQIMRMVK